jgi:ribose transport system substrate-binding protein
VGKIDLFPVGSLEKPRRIVTDSGIHTSDVRALVDQGARVTVCSADGHVTYRPHRSGKQVLKIGFANLSHYVWFAKRVREGLEQATQQERQVELIVKDNRDGLQKAIRNAEEFLEQDIDLLIEYNSAGSIVGRTVMRMMHLADVPVVAIDLPIIGATYFGCNHDAVGIMAGHALGQWVQDHWDGHVDEIMLIAAGRGEDSERNDSVRARDAAEGTLGPRVRLEAALDTFQTRVQSTPYVRRSGGPSLTKSEEAVSGSTEFFAQTIMSIPRGYRVVAVCIIDELALGLAQAVRSAQREDHFAVISFGTPGAAMRSELANPRTCMIGLVDLHPERYGQNLLDVCLRILAGSAVPPAVFVEHEFLSSVEVRTRSVL